MLQTTQSAGTGPPAVGNKASLAKKRGVVDDEVVLEEDIPVELPEPVGHEALAFEPEEHRGALARFAPEQARRNRQVAGEMPVAHDAEGDLHGTGRNPLVGRVRLDPPMAETELSGTERGVEGDDGVGDRLPPGGARAGPGGSLEASPRVARLVVEVWDAEENLHESVARTADIHTQTPGGRQSPAGRANGLR
jgi:hypothetical protein